MNANEKLVDVLNELIRINKDRTAGYNKAIEELETKDIDLQNMFAKMSSTSADYAAALQSEVVKLGGEPAKDTTQSGKLYRLWMDLRSSVSAHDRKAVLDLCEFGEDTALKAYNTALNSDAEMPADIRQLINEQKSNIQNAHDIVKRYRDMHAAIEH